MIPVKEVPRIKQSASMSVLPDRTDDLARPAGLDKRRVSWAFEHPEIPDCADPSLDDVKSLLKKQIRSSVETPDFIYLTISALKNQVMSTYPYEHSNNHEFPKPSHARKETSARKPILRHRPKSSPSSIDTKTKASLVEGMAEFLEEHAHAEDGKSMKSGRTSGGRTTHSARSVEKSNQSTTGGAQRAQSAQILRVQSAGLPRSKSADSWRVKTAKKLGEKTKGHHGLTTTATETSIVPMLMYPKDGLKPSLNSSNVKKWPSQQSIAKHHPLCADNNLKLRTYTQEMKHLANIQVHVNSAKQKSAPVPC